MESIIILALGVAFFSTSIYFLYSSPKRRSAFLRRFRLRRHRDSDAKTPPRSLSPSSSGKKTLEELWAEAEYKSTFPPSRRFNLAQCGLKNVECPEGGWNEKRNAKHIPLTVPFDQMDSEALSPTDITVGEIKALGDFPDYAMLSGVPLPQPYREFDVKKALPRPYRPFRWTYHQTMSLTKLEPDWWLELEKTYVDRIRQRQELFAKHGKSVLDCLLGSEHACKELMEMCLQFLCARYPQYFDLDEENMLFHNGILGTTANLKSTHALHVILNNVPEDFAIMLRDPETGFYHFRAGVICSALGWNLGTKIGLRLHEIHAPIPDYKEKMQFSMDRYFAKKPTEKSIQRGSWGLEIDEPLYMPPGDPHEKHREVQHPDLDISRCNLRVDWQTLRRLPLSGAVVFNFKAIFTPVEYFRDEPYIPSLILKILHEGKKSIMEYKNTWHTEHVVIPALKEYEREQKERGLIEENWEVHTLEESPYYPGWEEKWHRDQGF